MRIPTLAPPRLWVSVAAEESRPRPPVPRPFADRQLVWHPPGEKTIVHGHTLNGGFYQHDAVGRDGHPFVVSAQLPVSWQMPPYPPIYPDYSSMSPRHRGYYLVWLQFRDLLAVPPHSRLVYVETWLQGVEWRLLTDGPYDPRLVQELEQVWIVNQPQLAGTRMEQRILDLLCYSTFCHDRNAFSELWRRIAGHATTSIKSLARQLILTDLGEKGEPLTVDLAALMASVYWPALAEVFPTFKQRFSQKYPDGRMINQPWRTDRDLRYHSNYPAFESRAKQTCPRLSLANFDHEIGNLDHDALWWTFEHEARREATAKAAHEAEFQARLRTTTSSSPVAPQQPKEDSIVNPQRLETIAAETRAVREMLAPILAIPDQETPSSPEALKPAPDIPVPEWATGLQVCFVPAMAEIQSKPGWNKVEFDKVCGKHHLTPLAFQDAVNAWADGKFGDFLFEGGDPIRVNQHLLHRKP